MKKLIRFGINSYKRITGAELYVRAFQIFSILPAIHIFMIAGYPGIITRKGFFPVLFDIGASGLPRAELWLLSLVYRAFSSEIVMEFVMLAAALVFGLVMAKLLRGKEKRAYITRIVLAALMLADLVLRLLPLGFNTAFGTAANIVGFVIRLICLALVVLDIVFYRKGNNG